MFKRRKSILCLLIAVLMMASASTAAMAASPYETRYNNTVMASSVASISESGLLTVDNQLEEKRLKARSQLMLRRKRWGCFGRALILDSPIINGSMLYMIIYTTEPIHSS